MRKKDSKISPKKQEENKNKAELSGMEHKNKNT